MPLRKIAVHADPVWRDKANFIIRARLEETDKPHEYEQLWVRKVAQDQFELCCIPFFVFGLALGDVVRTAAGSGEDRLVASVVRPSRHSTYRVWFGGKHTYQEEVIADLLSLGALAERSSKDLVAIDAPTPQVAQAVVEQLMARQTSGDLVFEIGHEVT